jgi:hypothetical protein
VWSLRIWPTIVTVRGVDYEAPGLSAADWLTYLMQEEPDMDGLIAALFPAADNLLDDSLLDYDELQDIVLDLISTVTARSWWIALRMIAVARDSWHVLGPEMLRKADAEKLSIAAWLDILLVTTLNSMEPKETTMFVMRLENPPAEVKQELDDMEMDRSTFLSLAN